MQGTDDVPINTPNNAYEVIKHGEMMQESGYELIANPPNQPMVAKEGCEEEDGVIPGDSVL